MAFSLALGVTPESLQKQSVVIDTNIKDMLDKIQQLEEKVSGTKPYWEGKAGNKQRTNFEQQVVELKNMITRLQTYPTRIRQMAGIYIDAEESAVATASNTRTDIVMM